MADLPFETLIKGKYKSCSDRWYPIPIQTYANAFKLSGAYDETVALRKNLAYSMQYLEFLEKQLAELDLSSVIYVMVVKTYVITAMSVLEGIFTNIIKARGWWKTSQLESLGTTQANETKFDGQKLVVKTELLKKVDPYPLQMNLEELINILNRHHDALNVDHLVYPALKRLKELRNRIHLQKTDSTTDHDYNAFDYTVKKEMGSILLQILSSEMVTHYSFVFKFLEVNKDVEPESESDAETSE